MRCFPLLLMMAVAMACPAHAQKPGLTMPHDVDFTQIRVREGGPWYTVAIIRPDRGAPLWSGNTRHHLALRLGEAVQLFRIRNYKERHPEWASNYVDPAQDAPLDGRTTVVAIFEGEDPARMLATLWLSYTTEEDSVLRMEEHPLTGWTYPRPPKSTISQFPFHDFESPGLEAWKADFPGALGGDVVELKSYIQDAASAEDFIPLLYYFGELDWGYYRRWKWVYLSPAEAKRRGRETTVFLPTEYALVTDPGIAPLYRRLGFEPVPGAPEGYAVMRATREAYVGIANRMKGRKGQELFELYRGLTLNSSCREALRPHTEEQPTLVKAIERSLNALLPTGARSR